ncbi:MAG TPA: MopE-related protein [Polyangiales bacterium]|nr:MopE-related protein [Polyangiales bacterium]
MRTLACGLSLVALLVSGCRQDAFCLNCPTNGGGAANGGGGGSGSDEGDGAVSGDGGETRGDGAAGTGGDGDGGPPLACEPLGDEVCNAIDDDCDGTVDEGFDFTNNPRHCGGCDQVCQGENAETACQDSQCVLTGCFAGFADLDQDPGCEYQCPVSPIVAEDCNGIDDDCDGKIDEQVVTPAVGARCNHIAGTPCENVTLVCDTRESLTTWFCAYPSTVQFDPVIPDGILPEETLCDGIDNDCDSSVDDPWPELGNSCDDGQLGACADGGRMVCAASKASTMCDLSLAPDPVPGAGPTATELCNGVDDNCDGTVDNSDPADPARIIDDMVHITHDGNFYIYRYEASRPDSTGTSGGISSTRACSKSGARPWDHVTFAAATAACDASGLRLCTPAEWQAACEGTADRLYPYGISYVAATCNGTNYDTMPGGAIDNNALATGAMNMCVSMDGLFDMSGNLKEWTNDLQGTTGSPPENIYVLRGGSYESPELGMTCQTTLSRASASTVLPNVGFRCCKTTAQ